MTVRMAKLIKAIPKARTMREAGKIAGYTSNDIYRKRIKSQIMETLKVEPESIKAHYEMLYNLCINEHDKATAKGILDSLCRITGMNKDNTTLSVRYAPDKLSYEEFKAISDKQSQDIPQLSQKSDVPNNEIASDEGVGVSP